MANIVTRAPNIYNNNEGWVVKKMKPKYFNRIIVIMHIIYWKDKVQYFSNKCAMMIFKADHGECVNWATIMYFQLVKELIRWDKCQENMIEGIAKREPKKDVCHFAIIIKILFQKWFLVKEA
jgi:hypothetical protein